MNIIILVAFLLIIIFVIKKIFVPAWVDDQQKQFPDEPEFTNSRWYEEQYRQPIPTSQSIRDPDENRLIHGKPRTLYYNPDYEHAPPQPNTITQDDDTETTTLADLMDKR